MKEIEEHLNLIMKSEIESYERIEAILKALYFEEVVRIKEDDDEEDDEYERKVFCCLPNSDDFEAAFISFTKYPEFNNPFRFAAISHSFIRKGDLDDQINMLGVNEIFDIGDNDDCAIFEVYSEEQFLTILYALQ